MAKLPVKKFRDVTVLFSDEATSPTYEAFCGITSITINRNTETTSENIPDCPEVDDEVDYTSDEITAIQWVLDFEALSHDDLWEYIEDWSLNEPNAEKFIRILYKNTDGSQFYYALPVKLINPNDTGTRNENWTSNFTLNGQAKPTKVTLP